jgi:hypothetical protein
MPENSFFIKLNQLFLITVVFFLYFSKKISADKSAYKTKKKKTREDKKKE